MSSAEFSKIRSILWPIHSRELKKFLPMSAIIFFILFNYTILRNMKDTLVVNSAGASLITFLKLYCVTPSAVLFVVMYMKVSSLVSRENIFYVMLAPFLVFFLIFAFFLYPNVDAIHPAKETIEGLYKTAPNLKGFIDIYAYWSYSLFYVLSEIWGSVGVSLLFWQFANQVVKMDESKRFYALFIAIGNLSLIACGVISSYLSSGVESIIPKGMDKWTFSLTVQMVLVAIGGTIAMLLYRWLHVAVLPFEKQDEEQKPKKGKKEKPGLGESMRIIFASKHLQLIAALVIAYGVSINLVEVQWKNQVKNYYLGDKVGFNKFMNVYSMWTGFTSIIFGWFVGSGILKKLSWSIAAIVTPLAVLAGGVVFFVATFSGGIFNSLGINPIAVAAFMGAGVVLVSKVIKYGLFDPTKEMAYIPLDVELKTKGKAAVDVIGGRVGKAGGAFTQSMLLVLMATTNVVAIAPFSAAIFLVVCVMWCYAVKALGKEMKKFQS